MHKTKVFFKIVLASLLVLGGSFSVSAQSVGDVNCDGIVNIVDALVIAQYSVGLVDTLGCTSTTATPVTTTTVTPTPTPTPYTGVVTPAPVVDNPFVGVQWYVNTDWTELAVAAGGSAFADISSAVWMDRIGAITEGTGLVGHMDRALAQGANMIMIVIYDLPGRDCAASASNGELPNSAAGLERYKTEYIDPIVAIMGRPEYAGLNIVCIIEPDSLPNLVTNLGIANCSAVNQTGVYVDGIRYAISQLDTLPNTYQYVDIAHSGWLGWDSNFQPGVDLISDVISGTTNGYDSVAGFISNTANYTPVEEPYLPNPRLQINYTEIRSADYYAWNFYFEERDFVVDMRSAFISKGFPSTIGMLVDTARNGWGGPARPTAVSTSTDINTYVNESRIDKRLHRGNWCNQVGAGIGLRPVAAPVAGIDAYVWSKPPGESDGVSEPGISDPVDESKTYDSMCGPDEQSTYDSAYKTGAMPNSPHAGRWNEAQFQELVQNAYPAF